MISSIDPKEELLIVSHVTGLDVQSLQLGGCLFTDENQRKIDELVALRMSGVPFAQVVGVVEFLDVFVGLSNEVLIPRPETEILVEKALSQMSDKGSVLDLCTGSGCIGLAVKKAKPKLRVICSDISPAAIDIVKMNAQKNGIQVECMVAHLFDCLLNEKVDYLFCNPPYISSSDYHSLDKSVKDYEPKIALVGGDDGLMFYRMIEKEVKHNLNPGAKCFFEIGYDQGKNVIEIFSNPVWTNKKVFPDYAGHDRFFFLEFHP